MKTDMTKSYIAFPKKTTMNTITSIAVNHPYSCVKFSYANKQINEITIHD